MTKYRCEGATGCKKAGCEFTDNAVRENESERIYMCPFNHWRSCKWVEVEDPPLTNE